MYNSETEKIAPRIADYLGEVCVDIGCHHVKVSDASVGIADEIGPMVGLTVKDYVKVAEECPELIGICDAVFSSHLLPNIQDWESALQSWVRLLKSGGRLVIYLPDDRLYDYTLNANAVHRFQYEAFCEHVSMLIPELQMIDGGFDIGPDKYSFFAVFSKKEVVSGRFFLSKATHSLLRITSSDYAALRQMYDLTDRHLQRKAIEAAVDEIEWLTRQIEKLKRGSE